MASAPGGVAGHGGGDDAELQRQGIGGGMGVYRQTPTRFGRKDDHPLVGIARRVGVLRGLWSDSHTLRTAGPSQPLRS